MPMQKIRLKWRGPFDPYGDYPDAYFYMMYDKRKRKVIYIGQAYYQSPRRRVSQHGDLLDWIRRSKSIHVADVRMKVAEITSMNQQRVSKEIIDDIESLMIIVVQPPGNIQSTRTYYGRDLQIENTGKYSPLPRRISTKDIE